MYLTCHHSCNGLEEREIKDTVLTKPVKVLQEGGVMPPLILTGLLSSYDTFTYLSEKKSFSFISVNALQRISKIHLYLFEVLLPGDMLLGCRTELI